MCKFYKSFKAVNLTGTDRFSVKIPVSEEKPCCRKIEEIDD